MTHIDCFPRFSPRSAWRGGAGHRELRGTPPENLGKPPFRSLGRTAGGRRETSTTRGYWVLKGTPQDRIDVLSKALVKAMKHGTFANYLKSAGLDPETSVAGHEVWDKDIKEEYAKAVQALKDLDLL